MSGLARRVLTVGGVALAALLLVLLLPVWFPLAALADLVRRNRRFPVVRLLLFALCWSWLEVVGVILAFGLFLIGRGRAQEANYRLQRWWARQLMRVMRFTCAMELRIDGLDQLRPAPVVVLARHASLADSLVSAYVICDQARLYPRYVLKRELRSDPVLDIVGSRIPNHFLDRSAADADGELDALRALSSGLDDNSVAVIFPEGTRANPAKRTRALTKIAERDPARAARLSHLTQLLPPRPAGTRALLDGAPGVDVVVAWHSGFEGFDTFGGILGGLSRPVRIHFVMRRISRAEVPEGDDFERWLDETWSTMDLAVQADLDGRVRQTP